MHQNFLKIIILKTFIHIFALLLFSAYIYAQSPKYETRAVWLTTIGGIDWPHTYYQAEQKRELIRILDQLQRAHINTILIQTRVRSTTIFPSQMEPWDGCLSGNPGVSPGYDGLQFCIDECHKRGMECHAWIVTIPVGKWNSYGCKELRRKYPSLIRKIGDDGYMNPEMSQTGDYLAQFCREVTRRYDVDGIHLDYIRYPENWKLSVSQHQGRQYITRIVQKIYSAVKSEKPWVKLSCSPIGKYDDLTRFRSSGWNAYSVVCQDAQGWLREGLMDALFPMMYFQGNNFYPFLADWKQHSYGRTIAPGLAIYMMHPRENNWNLNIIKQEMGVLRSEGLGVTFFRSKFFTDNTKNIYNFTKDFNREPALIPPMIWYRKQSPTPSRDISIKRGMKADQLVWSEAYDHSGGDYLLYNVYASHVYPVDISNASNLISMRQRERSLTVPHGGKKLNYAITAIDRYGNESHPLQSQQLVGSLHRNIDFRSLIMGK